jgi:hypothetical protein
LATAIWEIALAGGASTDFVPGRAPTAISSPDWPSTVTGCGVPRTRVSARAHVDATANAMPSTNAAKRAGRREFAALCEARCFEDAICDFLCQTIDLKHTRYRPPTKANKSRRRLYQRRSPASCWGTFFPATACHEACDGITECIVGPISGLAHPAFGHLTPRHLIRSPRIVLPTCRRTVIFSFFAGLESTRWRQYSRQTTSTHSRPWRRSFPKSRRCRCRPATQCRSCRCRCSPRIRRSTKCRR